MTIEFDDDTRGYRIRQRPTPRRVITLEPDAPEPEERTERLLPSKNDRYDLGELPTNVAQQIKRLAITSRGASRALIMNYLTPFLMRGTPHAEMARVFDVSTKTIQRWIKEHREYLREEALKIDPATEYASQKERIRSMMIVAAAETSRQGDTPAETARIKARAIRNYADLERLMLQLNVNFGVAHSGAMREARAAENTDTGGSDNTAQLMRDVFSRPLDFLDDERTAEEVLRTFNGS